MTTIQFDNGRVEVHSSHAYVFVDGELPAAAYDTARNRWVPNARALGSPWPSGSLSVLEVATRVGATESFIRDVEQAAASSMRAAQRAIQDEWEAGRRAWQARSQDERDAMNRYAMETEGHAID